MLQKPDVATQRILELANFLDNLEPERFSMGTWGQWQEPRCICGWYQQLHGHINKEDWRQAADGMGIPHSLAHSLFHYCIGSATPHNAARLLRHLAVTGELPH